MTNSLTPIPPDTYMEKGKGKSFKLSHPDLAKEFHPTKNGNLTPDFFAQSKAQESVVDV